MASWPQLELPPGFRFHPTDEELVVHYLSRRAACRPFPIPIIAEIDLYKFDPWDLPQKALFGEREWYFFSPRDRKYPNGVRPNRAAASGYWKATGTDKPILSNDKVGLIKRIGVKKALVFYEGRAPKGVKTDWIMHEYRLLSDSSTLKASSITRNDSLRLDDCVLCRIYKKSRSFNQCRSAAMASPNMEVEEESCLEDMLASLPDIDNDSELFLPRLRSSNTAHMKQENHTMVDNFSTAPDYRNTINKNFVAIHHPHGETYPQYSDSTYKKIHADSDAKLPAGDHVLSMQTCEWRGDPCSESMNEINLDVLQSIIKKKMKMHMFTELDEVQQSVCSPSSASNCRQQQNVDQQQNLHKGGYNTAANSSIYSLHMAFDHLPYLQQSDDSTTPIRLETCECHFPRLNGFYVQRYS